MSERRTLPLRLTQKGVDPPVLLLNGADITNFVAARGLSIDYSDDYGGASVPVVTITFAPGALDLDFDVDLLERLLDDAKAAGE